MGEHDYQVEKTFFGGAIPGLNVTASNGSVVSVVINIVMQKEEDTLRKFARWIEGEMAARTLAAGAPGGIANGQ